MVGELINAEKTNPQTPLVRGDQKEDGRGEQVPYESVERGFLAYILKKNKVYKDHKIRFSPFFFEKVRGFYEGVRGGWVKK